MEGGKRRAKGGSTTCIPRRPRGGNRRASPAVSLLDRFREAVFKLIMLSAISKGEQRQGRRPVGTAGARMYRCDSYRSEAVEDCIEFFKRSASAEEVEGSGVGEDAVVEVAAFRPYEPCEV